MFEFIELFSELGVYLGNSGKAGNAGARKILKRSPRVTFCIREDWSIGLNDLTKTRVHTHAYQDTINGRSNISLMHDGGVPFFQSFKTEAGV